MADTGKPTYEELEARLREMEEFRTPLYRDCADWQVENTGSITQAVRRVLGAFEYSLALPSGQ